MNRLLTSGLLVLAATASGLGYVGWKKHVAQREWSATRPELPALVGPASPGLDARLAALSSRLSQYPPDPAALAEFTRVCHANGELSSAIAGYTTLLKMEPAEPRWPYRLASILAGYGRLAEAVPHLRRTVELAPDYLTARLKVAEALLKSNATTEAEAVYTEVLRRDAENIYGLVGLARCQLQAEQLTFARSTLQRAVASHPESSNAQSLLGTVLERLGNAQGAELARNRVRQGGHYAEPADPWMSELLADCHDPYTLLIASSAAVAESRSADALPILARGLALAPNDARLHRQLAKTHASMGE
jgi:Flp pilus assembly protein TadD